VHTQARRLLFWESVQFKGVIMRLPSGFMKRSSVLVVALAGCASSPAPDELLAGPDNEDAVAQTGGTAYFAIAADQRKCASPVCGGWFVERLNRATTICHDGARAAQCYTPVLDWSNANLSIDQQATLLGACTQPLSEGVYAIVRGQFARRNTTTPRPDLGRFVITEAWVAEADMPSSGAFVKLRDNGLRCFAPPCPSLTETTLNLSTSVDIAGLDWTPSAMTEAQIEECTGDLFTVDGLLVAGARYTFTENGTAADGRTVTVAYQRLVP
jgi:hypothetical protein